MANQQQVAADIHAQDAIVVLNQDIIQVANDNTDDDASSQDSGDAPDDSQGNQSLIDNAQVDVQQQWKFLKKKERELEARERAVYQRHKDAEKQAKIIQTIDARTTDRRGGDLVSRNSSSSNSPISSIRPMETFTERLQLTKENIIKQQDTYGEVLLQPTQQLQITALKKELAVGSKQIKNFMLTMKLLEERQQERYCPERQAEIEDLQNEVLELTEETEQLRVRLDKTKETAEKFQSFMQMPTYREFPAGRRRDKDPLDPKLIHKSIFKAFDPSNEKNTKLEFFWLQILRYGRANYLNEEEHLIVLGECLLGPALATYEGCMERNFDLRETLNELSVMYGSTVTINDYKKELNNFSREPGESIRRCMSRYYTILTKTKHGIPDHVWVHTAQLKQMMALKQFTTESTRAHIEQEELRNASEGSSMMPIQYWISRVDEYEMAHNQVPQKAMKSMIMTASLAPSFSQDQIDKTEKQLHHFKVNQVQSSNMNDRMRQLEEIVQNVSVASAIHRPRKDYAKQSKPYNVLKHGKKERSGHTEKRYDSKMEVDQPVTASPSWLPDKPKISDQTGQKLEKKNWFDKDGQKKKFKFDRNKSGYKSNNSQDKPKTTILKINGKFFGNIEEMEHTQEFLKRFQQKKKEQEQQSQQVHTNAVEEDSDDEEETEDQNEEGYSDDEPDFEVIEFEASEN